ncbi:MAG: 2-hydroxyglutaryl-CoA dehydratase [Desulfobacterales bacterium]|nr:2-hydroxyglutaryl-CoA dehydratase [Desulfobacterales bacterium]
MTIIAGCDVGSLTSKAVIMQQDKILAVEIIKSKAKPQESANLVLENALTKAGLKLPDVQFIVGTGYGRDHIPFVHKTMSEISCHARGAKWLVPSAKTIIDIGGQDCKVIKLDKTGNVSKFIANDKCASGTGRFLEVMARMMNISIQELGEVSEKSKQPIQFASMCTVWAQADVVKYLNSGFALEDIGAGINMAMANRVSMLVSAIGIETDICMTGGVSKNSGVFVSLERILGHKIKKARKLDPQLAGALGAALIANDQIKGRA